MTNISTLAGAAGHSAVADNGGEAGVAGDYVEPFRPYDRVVWRPSRLSAKAVIEIYEAQSYLRWRYETCFTTHVTITARKLGISDQREFSRLLAQWNKEMKRWLSIDRKTPRKRWTPRTRMAIGQQHLWVYVIESSLSQGIHAHELCVVPYEQRKAFDRHVRDWWHRASCLGDLDPQAIAIRHGRPIGGTGRKRHVFWVRYILKTAAHINFIGSDGFEHPAAEVLRLRSHDGTPDVYVAQLHGVCRALGPQTRQRPLGNRAIERFVSPLAAGNFDHAFSDWEELACRHRTLVVLTCH